MSNEYSESDEPSPKSLDYASPPLPRWTRSPSQPYRSAIELVGGMAVIVGAVLLIFNVRSMDDRGWAFIGTMIAGFGVIISLQGYILTEVRRSRK